MEKMTTPATILKQVRNLGNNHGQDNYYTQQQGGKGKLIPAGLFQDSIDNCYDNAYPGQLKNQFCIHKLFLLF
jgi:hypothetical protein